MDLQWSALGALALCLHDLLIRRKLYLAMLTVISGRVGWGTLLVFYALVLASEALVLLGALRASRRLRGLGALALGGWIFGQREFALVLGHSIEPADVARFFHVDRATLGAVALAPSADSLLRCVLLAVAGVAAAGFFLRRIEARPRAKLVHAAWPLALGLALQTAIWIRCDTSFHMYRMPVAPLSDLYRAAVYATNEYFTFEKIAREMPLVSLDGSTGPRTDNIVFVLDESVRGDLLPVRGGRPDVTPRLARALREHPAAFRDYSPAISTATCSEEAHDELFTGLEKLPDLDKRALRNPMIWDWAKAAGYRPWLVDGHGTPYPTQVIRAVDLAKLDRFVPLSEIAPKRGATIDIEIADWLREKLRSERGLFVVVMKLGAHPPYEAKYPHPARELASLREPTLGPNQIRSDNAQAQWNSYANAVEYSVDGFFDRLRPWELPNLRLLYTSDHAQNLGERGERFSHCSVGLEQALVPLFTLDTRGKSAAPPSDPAIVHSQREIYPTLVGWLTGKAETRWGDFQSLEARPAKQASLYYTSGSIWRDTIVVPVAVSEVIR